MSTELTTKPEVTSQVIVRGDSAFSSMETFEKAQRMARALAESAIVPKEYQRNLSNCIVALEVAQRTGSSIFAVMQSLDIIHGRPSWKSSYIIGAINSSGRFASELRFKTKELGKKQIDKIDIEDVSCIAYAVDKSGEIVEGPKVTIEMAVREGWYTRAGSKWRTMPELMLRYRAAAFFGRLYCPDLLLGMASEDEMRDVTPQAIDPVPESVKGVNEKIRKAPKAKEPAPVVIEATAQEITEPEGAPPEASGEEFF